MRNVIKLTAILFVTLVLCAQLKAQEEARWETHGPYGGLVFRIQVDSTNSSRVLTYTTRGNYISEDAGATWKFILPPKKLDWWRSMKLLGGKLYCESPNGLYVRGDDGEWKKEADLGGQPLCFTCEPGKPQNLWCLFYSRVDKAKVWICAASKEGKNWKTVRIKEVEADFPDSWSSYLDRLVISPVDPSIIRAFVVCSGQLGQLNKNYVFGSDDGGKTWESWTTDAAPLAVAFSRTEPKTIYGAVWKHPGKISGLVKSKDGAKTWEPVSNDKRISSMRALILHPKTGELFLGTTDNGLFKTTDEGKTLVILNSGLYNRNISALAADPADEKVLYAGTQCGLFKSTDGGKNWKWISKGIRGCQITGLVTFEHDPDRVCVFEYHQGIRVSTDGCKTWSAVEFPNKLPGKVWSPFHKGKTLLSLMWREEGYVTCVSRDMGLSWKVVEGLAEDDLPVAVVSDTEMFAARQKVSLLKSVDGVKWKPFAGPFDEIGDYIRWVGRPKGKEYLLIAGGKAVAKCESSSGKRLGSVKVPEELAPLLWAHALDPRDPEVLYGQNHKGEVLRCNLRTQEWTKLYTRQDKEKEGVRAAGIVFDPGKEQRLITAFIDGHIAVSEDSGKSWEPFKPEMHFHQIGNAAVTAKRILIIRGNGAIYTLDLSKLK